MQNGLLWQRLAILVTLPVLACLAAGWVWLDDPALFFKEGHTIEICSVMLLIQGIACWFCVHGREGWREWQVPAILLLFALREMDFDKRFTESGVLKLRTYTGDGPLGEKLVGAATILFALVVVTRLLRRNGPGWRRDLRRLRPHALAVLLAGLLIGAAKSLDGLARKLLDFGIVISRDLDRTTGQVEEVAELASWWLLALAVALLPAAHRRTRAASGAAGIALPGAARD